MGLARLAVIAWLCAVPQMLAQAAEARSGNIVVSEGWSRPTPPGSTVGVAYFLITNTGDKADRLLALSTSIASSVELHESRTGHGVVEMHPLTSLECPAGGAVAASPRGLHAMLLGLSQSLRLGTVFILSLRFRDAGVVTLPVEVKAGDTTADP